MGQFIENSWTFHIDCPKYENFMNNCVKEVTFYLQPPFKNPHKVVKKAPWKYSGVSRTANFINVYVVFYKWTGLGQHLLGHELDFSEGGSEKVKWRLYGFKGLMDKAKNSKREQWLSEAPKSWAIKQMKQQYELYKEEQNNHNYSFI